MSTNIEFDPTKTSKGGFASILEIRGVLVSHERITNKFGETRKKYGTDIDEVAPDQIQVSYEEVEILRMEEGEEEPDLEDGKFSILINYAKPGQEKAHRLSQWNFGYTDSCKEVYNTFPSELVGQVVQMAKVELTMKMKDRETKEDREITMSRWCFVPVSDVSVDLDGLCRTKIEGKNKSAALRELQLDNKLRRVTAYRDAVAAGNPLVGLELVEGLYVEATPA